MDRRGKAGPLRFVEDATSGQIGPKLTGVSKKPHKQFRQESAEAPQPERFHRDADSSGYTTRTEKQSARREQKGVKPMPASDKRPKRKPLIKKNLDEVRKKDAAGFAAYAAGGQALNILHGKVHEAEQENTGVEAAHKTELAGEGVIRETARFAKRHSRARQAPRARTWEKSDTVANADGHYTKAAAYPDQSKKALARQAQKQRQKRRIQRQTQAAMQSARAAQKAASTARKVGFAVRHPILTIVLVVVVLIVFIILSAVSGTAAIGSGVSGVVAASSYLAADEDIDRAELAYTEWEADLQLEIQNMESARPGYDEYRYDVDDIGHNPYELMAFLTAVYDDFSYSGIEGVLRDIFNEQYILTTKESTETRTETRTIQVGDAIGQVRTTAYCNCVSCNGKWAGGPTASGAMPTAGHTIAVDAYNPIVPMGTKVVMNGVIYTVEDTGNLNANNSDIDVYHNTHAEALAWGRQNHTMYLAEGGSNSIEVSATYEARILEISLTAQSFTGLVYTRMDAEQMERYNVLMATKGNRQYVHSPFGETNWLPYVTAYYGYRATEGGGKDYHKGIDIGMPQGTEILAGQAGTVTFAGNTGDYGLVVVIEGEDELETKYAHCSALLVSAGQEVQAGDVIAKTGPRLHLEILKNGAYLNPLYFAITNDYGTGPTYGGDPGPAMGDGSYTALVAEAEKHLGKPYVFGASGPDSFDCSGFVCYVLNHSGVKDVGRTNAQGLYNMCTPIAPGNAQPGDLIFFSGTYSTPNACSHVGIYVGGGTMIHAGKPVQYSSINTPYWQSHFYSYGRLN